MRVHFHPRDGSTRIEATLPYEGADQVTITGPCPNCKVAPCALQGVKGTPVEGHDTITSDAGCTSCKTVIGRLVVTVSTIFGIAEDRAVLRGRPRVY